VPFRIQWMWRRSRGIVGNLNWPSHILAGSDVCPEKKGAERRPFHIQAAAAAKPSTGSGPY
jgi:hypothetical protein